MDGLEIVNLKSLTLPKIERAVLGQIIAESAPALAVAGNLLLLDDFYETPNRHVFEAITAVIARNAEPDLLSVVEELRTTNRLTGVGGPATVARLAFDTGNITNLEYYCRLLNEARAKRTLFNLSQQIQYALSQDQDVFDMLATSSTTLTGIQTSFGGQRVRTLRDAAVDAYNLVANRIDQPVTTRVRFGIRTLDATTGGLEPGDFVVIGGRPGMGKTDVAVHLIRFNTLLHGLPGAMFSLEMTDIQLAFRFLAQPSAIPARLMRTGLKREDLPFLQAAVEDLDNSELLYVDDRAALTIPALRAAVAALKAKNPLLAYIVVDYLQLMKALGRGNSVDAIEEISRGLKSIGKEFQLVVFALAQLSREVEKRNPYPVPQKSDLRGGGQIEQDADFIIFPYRPDYYGFKVDSTGEQEVAPDFTEFIVDKNRHGSPGIAYAKYDPVNSHFTCEEELAIWATTGNIRSSIPSDFHEKDPF